MVHRSFYTVSLDSLHGVRPYPPSPTPPSGEEDQRSFFTVGSSPSDVGVAEGGDEPVGKVVGAVSG